MVRLRSKARLSSHHDQLGVGLTSLQLFGEMESNKKGNYAGRWEFVRKRSPPSEREAFMKTLIHLKRHGNGYLHVHPLHAMSALVASFVLAVLIVLVLVSSAR